MTVIRLMAETDRTETALFVQRVMREHYHCEAHELPLVVFVGYVEEKLVGVMAISLSVGEPFPLEETYSLDYSTFPGIFDRTRIVQLGRWIATVPNIAEALVYAAVYHSLCNGYVWAIGEVKPKIARRYSRMGLRLFPLSGCPRFGHIHSSVLPYYILPPAPIPCALSLQEAEQRLRVKVAPYITRNEIVMHY